MQILSPLGLREFAFFSPESSQLACNVLHWLAICWSVFLVGQIASVEFAVTCVLTMEGAAPFWRSLLSCKKG